MGHAVLEVQGLVARARSVTEELASPGRRGLVSLAVENLRLGANRFPRATRVDRTNRDA